MINPNIYKLVAKFIISFLFLNLIAIHSSFAEDDSDDDDSSESWMTSSLSGLGRIFSCIERPEFTTIETHEVDLKLQEAGTWQPIGAVVKEGKFLKFQWGVSNTNSEPRRYKVLFRIDPRFENMQTFVQKYDYKNKKYTINVDKNIPIQLALLLGFVDKKINELNKLSIAELATYKLPPDSDPSESLPWEALSTSEILSLMNKISVDAGEVVNISIDKEASFFGSGFLNEDEYSKEFFGDSNYQPHKYYTTVPTGENKIVYINAKNWCEALNIPSSQCPDNTYRNNMPPSALVGDLREPKFPAAYSSATSCPDSTTGGDHGLCYYDNGAGIVISQGGMVIKDMYQKFTNSNISNEYFLHHKAIKSGDLVFSKGALGNMFNGVDPSYVSVTNQYSNEDPVTRAQKFSQGIAARTSSYAQNYIYMGRYVFDIEVGNGSELSDDQKSGIGLEYYIQPRDGDETTVPNKLTSGTPINGMTNKKNAEKSGYLWVRVKPSNTELSGDVTLKIVNYRGSSWFSDVVYHSLVKPLQEKYNEISSIIYSKLATNAMLMNIARICISLYIIIYGLMYLLGATQITVNELVIRVVKIILVITAFSSSSWKFFNGYLFQAFTGGVEYLFSNIIGITSQVGNMFGFVDPVLDKFTSGTFWGLLFIQLLQISNGLFVFAILTIYSMLIYFRALLEIIINYCLAFLGMSVLISLAPFFIILMLFERTRSMFDNWLSTLLNYMIQPTILLIFFLLIDQLMSQQITNVVLRACWGILIPIKIGLDLNHLGVPFSFSFQIPFLPGIPFFVSQVEGVNSGATLFSQKGTFMMIASSSLLFYAYCKISSGMLNYVDLISQSLTNVMAARQEGRVGQDANPTLGIVADLKSSAGYAARPLTASKEFFRDRVIGQKYQYRSSDRNEGEIDYSSINRSNNSGATNNNSPLALPLRDDNYNKSASEVSRVNAQKASSGPALPSRDDNYNKSASEVSRVNEQKASSGPALPSRDDNYNKSASEVSRVNSQKASSGPALPSRDEKYKEQTNRVDTLKRGSNPGTDDSGNNK